MLTHYTIVMRTTDGEVVHTKHFKRDSRLAAFAIFFFVYIVNVGAGTYDNIEWLQLYEGKKRVAELRYIGYMPGRMPPENTEGKD